MNRADTTSVEAAQNAVALLLQPGLDPDDMLEDQERALVWATTSIAMSLITITESLNQVATEIMELRTEMTT